MCSGIGIDIEGDERLDGIWAYAAKQATYTVRSMIIFNDCGLYVYSMIP
jgi:hypothetical protein